MPPDAEKGYGPNMSARKARISGWRSNDSWTESPIGGGGGISVAGIHVFGFGWLPSGASGVVQPSRVSPSSSNDVEPAPVDTTMSSMPTPVPWTQQSLAYVIETSNEPGGSLTFHDSQPSLCPLLAFHVPVEPPATQENSSSSGFSGSPSLDVSVM